MLAQYHGSGAYPFEGFHFKARNIQMAAGDGFLQPTHWANGSWLTKSTLTSCNWESCFCVPLSEIKKRNFLNQICHGYCSKLHMCAIQMVKYRLSANNGAQGFGRSQLAPNRPFEGYPKVFSKLLLLLPYSHLVCLFLLWIVLFILHRCLAPLPHAFSG